MDGVGTQFTHIHTYISCLERWCLGGVVGGEKVLYVGHGTTLERASWNELGEKEWSEEGKRAARNKLKIT